MLFQRNSCHGNPTAPAPVTTCLSNLHDLLALIAKNIKGLYGLQKNSQTRKEKKNTRCDIFKRRSFFSTQFFQMLWHNVPKVTSFLTFESSTWGLTNIVSWPRTMIRLVFLTVPFLNFGFFLTKKDYVFPSDHEQLLTESRKLELEANLHVLGWHYVMLHAWSTRECGDEMIAYTTFPRALCMRSFFPGA